MTGPCARPECGGEVHTDPWGTPVQCPHAEPVADTGRRCPRCDCPDGHEQCQHCKVCPHAYTRPGTSPLGMFIAAERSTPPNAVAFPPPAPDIRIIGADGTPLVTIHPTGELEYGPGYTPDGAARAFWDALRRLMPARCPACGDIGLEAP